MKTVQGDLIQLALDKKFDVIIHGCNCFCTMGAGIARSIKTEFPEAYKADCLTTRGDHHKLGTISTITVIRDEHEITIVNAYAQFHYRGSAIHYKGNDGKTIIKLLKNAWKKLKSNMQERGLVIH